MKRHKNSLVPHNIAIRAFAYANRNRTVLEKRAKKLFPISRALVGPLFPTPPDSRSSSESEYEDSENVSKSSTTARKSKKVGNRKVCNSCGRDPDEIPTSDSQDETDLSDTETTKTPVRSQKTENLSSSEASDSEESMEEGECETDKVENDNQQAGEKSEEEEGSSDTLDDK